MDASGQLWVGRDDGLFQLQPDGTLDKAWPARRSADGVHTNVRAIAQTHDGALWLSVYGDGLRRFDVSSGDIRRITGIADDAGLPENTISQLMVDRSGMLWVGGVLRGVSIADPRGARFQLLLGLGDAASDNPTASNSVHALHRDTTGKLWIATGNAQLFRYVILEIGEWVLREACSALGMWRAAGLVDLPVAVNVSSIQLMRGDFPQMVQRVLAETGIPANRLELELTESVLMANPVETSVSLQQFRELGVNLAIDDFGTGYSSLSYLKRLPITVLKIDKEFIDDLADDPDDAAITSSIIAMGLTVVAEGVETAEQVQWLQDNDCDEIQGFWLAAPMPADELLTFVRERLQSGAPDL